MDILPRYTTNTEEHMHKPVHRNMTKDKGNEAAAVKRTVKYLSVCKSPRAYNAVLRAAPDSVIKSIANAAYNVERGPLSLSAKQKALFRAHRKAIAAITSPAVGIKRKRQFIGSQTGGFPFIPLLIGSALGAFGSRLFGGAPKE